MKKQKICKIFLGILSIVAAISFAILLPGTDSVAYAAEGLSVTGVMGVYIPNKGEYHIPGTDAVLIFYVNESGDGVTLAKAWDCDCDVIVPAYVDGYPVTMIGNKEADSVGRNAFTGSDLTGITIPDTVKTIGEYVFSGCYNLQEVILPDSVENMEKGVFNHSGVRKVTLSGSMTQIPLSTFGECKNLTEVVIPDSITEIGVEAFWGCTSLENITLPASINKIGKHAFWQCSSLKSIVIPEGVTRIEETTFAGCSSLKSITIPASVTFISGSAFGEGSSLGTAQIKEIKYNGTPEQYKKIRIGSSAKKTINSVTVECSDGSKIVNGETVVPEVKATVKSVKLSSTSYTYNGKARKPSVTAVDSTGKKISSKYYTVSYKNNKNVGKATVTVKFKGIYKGTFKKTFTIKPAKTKISRTTAKSKGFTVKWKKNTKQVSGYQIQYSTSSKFSKGKTNSVYVKKASSTTRTIKKLKAKKRYYVRIRTYKTVKVKGKTTKIYSAWSPVKQIVTKK